MNYAVEYLPKHLAVLATMGEQFALKRDLAPLMEACRAVLDAAPCPVSIIDDTTRVKFSFADLVGALGAIARTDTGVIHHPNIRKIIFVTNNDIICLGSSALNRTQYGPKRIEIVHSLEKALTSVRAEATLSPS